MAAGGDTAETSGWADKLLRCVGSSHFRLKWGTSAFQSSISAYPGTVCLVVLETSQPCNWESSTLHSLFPSCSWVNVYGSDRVV